jgi:O-antigen/teichoic acid export membrane protein
MFIKKLISHSLIYAIGPQIPKIAGLFVLPIITRYLTTNDYGVYGIITSYVGILTAVSDLGFSIVLTNSFYSFPNRWPIIWKQLHFYLLLWSFIYGILLAALLYFIIPVEASAEKGNIIFLVCVPAILFNSTVVLGARYYQFAQKPMYVATVSALVGVIAIILNLYTISVLKMGYMGWVLSSFLSSLVQFLFFCYPVFYKYKLSPIFVYRKKFLSKNLKISLPTVPHAYSSYLLSSSDRVVMDRMKTPIQEVGKYNLAYTFGNYFDFFITAIGMAVGPFFIGLISQRKNEKDHNLSIIVHWLQYGFLLLGFTVSIWCKELLNLLVSNKELKLVYPIAIIIIMSYVSRPYYWVVVSRLQFFEKTMQFWKISLIAGIINVVLNIILVPFWGIMAATITTFFALLYMNFAGHFLKSYRALEKVKYYPVMMILLNIVATIIAYTLKDASIILKIGITAFVVAVFLKYSLNRWTIFKNIQV